MSRVETPIVTDGFLPELFTVAFGTYTGSPNHGIDTPPLNSLNSFTTKANCLITRQDKEVSFTLQINVKGVSPTPPVPAPTEELRIRATPGTDWLPLPNENFNAPMFDVQLFDTATGVLPAGTVNGALKARLLGNSLVLLREDDTSIPISYLPLSAGSYVINFPNDSYYLISGKYHAA